MPSADGRSARRPLGVFLELKWGAFLLFFRPGVRVGISRFSWKAEGHSCIWGWRRGIPLPIPVWNDPTPLLSQPVLRVFPLWAQTPSASLHASMTHFAAAAPCVCAIAGLIRDLRGRLKSLRRLLLTSRRPRPTWNFRGEPFPKPELENWKHVGSFLSCHTAAVSTPPASQHVEVTVGAV